MPNKKSNYNKNLKPFAKKLRKESTFGEVILWSKVLRAKNMMNYQFNRQFAIKLKDLNIIVDFICRKLNLIIEIDGYSHDFKFEEDKLRDNILSEHGYEILRISEKDIKYDLDNIIKEIENKIINIKNTSQSS